MGLTGISGDLDTGFSKESGDWDSLQAGKGGMEGQFVDRNRGHTCGNLNDLVWLQAVISLRVDGKVVSQYGIRHQDDIMGKHAESGSSSSGRSQLLSIIFYVYSTLSTPTSLLCTNQHLTIPL